MSQVDGLVSRLPWQIRPWQRLSVLHQNNTLPHALLLAGPQGIGKKHFAMAFAHYLLCASPRPEAPCGVCRQCGFNRAGTHPDLKLVEPEQKGKQIKIAQVRELVESLGQTSQQGGYKVSILSPAEAMNINAANSLLKCLEEPAPNTVLILLTDSPAQLLPTIRSRCQMLVFPLPSEDEARNWLASQIQDIEQVEPLLQEAAGQPMTALALLSSGGIEQRRDMRRDLMAMLNGRMMALELAEKWLQYDVQEMLAWLGHCMSEVIFFRMANRSLADDWKAVSAAADLRALFSLVDAINALRGMLSRGLNPNIQLALEQLLLETCETFHT